MSENGENVLTVSGLWLSMSTTPEHFESLKEI